MYETLSLNLLHFVTRCIFMKPSAVCMLHLYICFISDVTEGTGASLSMRYK